MPYLSADIALSKKLHRFDSRMRITWLRSKIDGYVRDLSVRHHLQIPCWIDGDVVADPRSEALQAAINFGIMASLSPEEIRIGFNIEWDMGVVMAVNVRKRCETVAARHIQLYRRRDDLHKALAQDEKCWPANWPFLTDDDMTIIAGRFQRHPGQEKSP